MYIVSYMIINPTTIALIHPIKRDKLTLIVFADCFPNTSRESLLEKGEKCPNRRRRFELLPRRIEKESHR